jgi:hypothetical protein
MRFYSSWIRRRAGQIRVCKCLHMAERRLGPLAWTAQSRPLGQIAPEHNDRSQKKHQRPAGQEKPATTDQNGINSFSIHGSLEEFQIRVDLSCTFPVHRL